MRMLVTLIVAGLLVGCAPYQRPGESAQDAFLRHENQRRNIRNAVSIMQQHDNAYYIHRSPSVTCTRDGGGNSITCQ